MLVLGEHNFAMAADRFVLLLVVFHVPGCDSCSSLRQEYLEASDVLYEYFIPVAKVRKEAVRCRGKKSFVAKEWRRLVANVKFVAEVLRQGCFEASDAPHHEYLIPPPRKGTEVFCRKGKEAASPYGGREHEKDVPAQGRLRYGKGRLRGSYVVVDVVL